MNSHVNMSEPIPCSDFISRSDETLAFIGNKEAINGLKFHVSLGFKQQHTSSSGFLCALYALEISLRPIYQRMRKTLLNFQRIRRIWKSSDYYQIVEARLADFFSLESE